MNEEMKQENIPEQGQDVAEIFLNEAEALRRFEGVENQVVSAKARLAKISSEMLQKVQEGTIAVDQAEIDRRTQELKEKFQK